MTKHQTPAAMAEEIKVFSKMLGDVRIMASRDRATHDEVRSASAALHAAIDRMRDALAAAMASSAQQGGPVVDWLNKFMPVVAQLDGIELVRRSDAVAAINARPTAPAEPERCEYCDDTGDVHTQTGEWRGVCTCPAGAALQANDITKIAKRKVTSMEAYAEWLDVRAEIASRKD